MRDRFEIFFWKVALYLLRTGYGYCEEPRSLGDKDLDNGCAGCKASEVQDWIKKHIQLIKDFL